MTAAANALPEQAMQLGPEERAEVVNALDGTDTEIRIIAVVDGGREPGYRRNRR